MKKSAIEQFLNEDGQLLYNNFENMIYSKFENQLLIKGKSIFVPYCIAEELVCEATKYPMTISGIDVFKMNEDGNEPLDISTYKVDTNESWLEYKETTHKSARLFFAEFKNISDIFFEFTFLTKDEYEQINTNRDRPK